MKVRGGFVLSVSVTAAQLILLAGTATPAVACTERRIDEGSRIEEAGFVPIGGIDQWVTIRGDDRSNPILLYVHGGPGMALSAFTDEFAAYAKDFTVVQWDQRGSGCTFGRYGEATPDVTLDRIAQVGLELAEYLEGRLGKRIIVLGHSLGSIVATEMVRRAPRRFAAYVGTGQFASFEGTVSAQLKYLREVAEANGNDDLTNRLDEIEKLDPQGLQQFFAINRLINAHVPAADAAWTQDLQSRAPKVMGQKGFAEWQAGARASVGWLLPQVRDTDLTSTAARFDLPYIVIQGSDDIFSPTALATAYFEKIYAPTKKLVVVKDAAHFALFTHTQQFLSALLRTTRPFARP